MRRLRAAPQRVPATMPPRRVRRNVSRRMCAVQPAAACRPRRGGAAAPYRRAAVRSAAAAATRGEARRRSPPRSAEPRPQRRVTASRRAPRRTSSAACLTIVKNPASPAFNLVMRRPPAYSFPIRCAANPARGGRRAALGRHRRCRLATAGASAPQAPRPPQAPPSPSRACRHPRPARDAAAAPDPAPPVRRFDALRVA